MTMVASSTLPALAGTTEEFTDESTEVALILEPSAADNTSMIKFPSDSRVRDASVTLRSNQDLMYTQVLADGGNMSAWSDTPDEVDLSILDVDSFMGTPFPGADLTKIALNSTASVKTTISSNASTHLFRFNMSAVLEETARDVSMVMDWTGMGTRMGTVAVDMVNLYVADFSKDRWHTWDEFDRVPSTGEQVAFTATMGPYSGWTDGEGMMYVMATIESFGPNTGTSMTTSHMLLQVWTSQAPKDLEVDVGGDGTPEFAWNGSGVGLYGLQNVLENGSADVSADFLTENEHVNLTSFLVPVGADIVEARVGLIGIPGDTVTSSLPEPAYISAQGMTTDTSIEDIPDHADPNWAQVVLTDLKNAGMMDQSQEIGSGSQSIGNYGGGETSVAQVFTPSITGQLVFINMSITGMVYDSPPDIDVEIRTVDGNSHPSDIIIGSSIINGALLNESSTKWHTVFFSDIALTQGVEYAIVLSASNAQAIETYDWKNHFNVTGDPYPGGKSFISATDNGSGPWLEHDHYDQAFVTYMETDIGTGVNLVKVAGTTFSEIRSGPSGDEYVFNITGVTKDPSGIWAFTITNANHFPVTFNWSGDVHSDTYPQLFGLLLSTEAGEAPYYTYTGVNASLEDYLWLTFTTGLADILDGAAVVYTAPNGVEYVRVNVTVNGSVTGGLVLSGLRVRYYLDIELTGPAVVAAADAFRAANDDLPNTFLPILVKSSVSAKVFLSDPYLEFDLLPTFTKVTQIIDEDGYGDEDLNSLFGDDHDNNNLTYTIVGVSVADAVEAVVNGTMLELTPFPNWTGELDVTVRGMDSSLQYIDGDIPVVVKPFNDPPVIDLPSTTFEAQAKETLTLDLSEHIYDVDNQQNELILTVNTSFITVDGQTLYCTYDEEGTYLVEMTVSDGPAETNETLTFVVSAPVGYPSIVGLPSEIKVPVNRPLPMDLMQYGEDGEDPQEDLTWSVEESSDLFDAVLAADGFNLTITPTAPGLGVGFMWLTVTDTDDHTVTERAEVNITERVLEAPRINHDALPEEIVLKLGGDSYVLELADFVEDETPVEYLIVTIEYSREGVVFVDSQDGILTFVPQEEGKCDVTVTLTDSDSRSSDFSVKVKVKSDVKDEPINWTIWILLMLIIVVIIILVAWPRKSSTPSTAPTIVDEVDKHMPPPPRVEKVTPHTFTTAAFRSLEDVLLFHSNGMLIAQLTRDLKEGVDADIEGAVISSIQEHIKGRMRTRDEPADVIALEGMQVIIERGADVAIAAVLTGAEPEGLRMQMRRTLNEIQIRNEAVLPNWDGNMVQLHGIDNAMVGIVEALIKEHHGVQDLSVDGAVSAPHVHHSSQKPVVDGIPDLENEDDPLMLVKEILGEEKTREIEEGHHAEEPTDEGDEGEKDA